MNFTVLKERMREKDIKRGLRCFLAVNFPVGHGEVDKTKQTKTYMLLHPNTHHYIA